MQGFGCKVIAYDIKDSNDLKAKGIKYKPFEEVLRTADIISIHCPLTPDTRHLFNSDAFAKMKKGMMLINTGRRAIINASQAIIALKSGQLGYLGIDVYEDEENLFFRNLSETIIQDDVIERLMSFNNVLITPHEGFLRMKPLSKLPLRPFKISPILKMEQSQKMK